MKLVRNALATALFAAGAFAVTGAQAATETYFVATPLDYTFSVSSAGNYSFSAWAVALGFGSKLYNDTTGDLIGSATSSIAGKASFNVVLDTVTNYTFKLTSIVPSHTLATVTVKGPGHIQSPLAPVPEPETYAMLLAGVGLVAAIARRRKSAAAAERELAAA